MVQWEVEADSFVASNCAYGCPSQFNATPTKEAREAIDVDVDVEARRGRGLLEKIVGGVRPA